MRSVELFAGAGGLGIGVSRAGFEPAAVIEWNCYCCDTIRENQKRWLAPVHHWPLTEGDIQAFDFQAISEGIDLVSGGPPCQPFSICGKHRGYLDKRDMFPEAVRAVRELQPRAFLVENVRGLTRPAFAGYFEYIRLQFTYPDLVARLGEKWMDHHARLERHHTRGHPDGLHYNLVARVLNAADYGVPQRRERVFIVGFRIESFWSMFKRGYHGTYHHISPKHLGRYVTEFSGRHNIRDMDTLAQMASIAKRLGNQRLRYADLVTENVT